MVGSDYNSLLDAVALAKKDLSTLSYDSIESAKLRMIWDSIHYNHYHLFDFIVFLGCLKDISCLPSLDSLVNHAPSQRSIFLEEMVLSLKQRHQEYLEFGKYKAVLRIFD